MAKPRIKYATMKNPVFEAIAHQMYAFKSESQAVEQIKTIQKDFIISKEQPEEDSKQLSVILWIKGFEITPEEEDKGVTGNFALIAYDKTEDDKFTLSATKLESDVKYHPQKKRPKKTHPNWGHPILRSVKKQRVYETIEETQSELQLLHEEYPTVTIPNPGKLYIMVYEKAEKGQIPIKKYILEIKASKEGGFYIEASENTFTGPVIKKEEETSSEAPDGYFTSMVQAKRGRKRPPPTEAE